MTFEQAPRVGAFRRSPRRVKRVDGGDLVLEDVLRRSAVHPLRVARVARGATQAQLEDAAGLPATSVSHIEAGRRVPDPAVRERLAMALDVDVDDLFPAHTLVNGGGS